MPSATIPKVLSTAAASLGLMAMAKNAQVTMKFVHLFQASKSVCLYLPKLDERIKNIDDFHDKAVYGNVKGSVGCKCVIFRALHPSQCSFYHAFHVSNATTCHQTILRVVEDKLCWLSFG